jgi:hypothetical protein
MQTDWYDNKNSLFLQFFLKAWKVTVIYWYWKCKFIYFIHTYMIIRSIFSFFVTKYILYVHVYFGENLSLVLKDMFSDPHLFSVFSLKSILLIVLKILISVIYQYCGICWKLIQAIVGSRVRKQDLDKKIFYLFCQNSSYNKNLGYRIAQYLFSYLSFKSEGII